MAEPEVLTQVPPQLQKLVRLVIRAFYQPEHYIVMDILARYPCVKETDLLELLKIDGKKLRMILSFLKKDKLIKSIQKMESVETESGDSKNFLSHYYYINYKVFVNVVKYKLDRMREKIQAEERRVRNRTSYICPNCQNTYSDLDVDRLIDPMEGVLKCIMCKTQLEEDLPEGDVIDARSVLSSLNEQLRPVLDLLKEMENVSLAPDVLDPEPQSIAGLIRESKYGRTKPQGKDHWTTSRADDIYGDQTISINIGTEEELKQKAIRKDAPQWMKQSTVYPSEGSGNVMEKESVPVTSTVKATAISGDEIMALLAHEEQKKDASHDHSSSSSSRDESSSEEDMEEQIEITPKLTWQDELSNQTGGSSFGREASNDSFQSEDDDEDSDDELTLKVGGKMYQLGEITPDLVASMTPGEKDQYTKLCQQAYSNYY